MITMTLLPRAMATASRCEGEASGQFSAQRGEPSPDQYSPRRSSLEEPQEVRSDTDLSTVEWSQEEAGLLIDVFTDKVILLAVEIDCLFDDRDRHLQERHRRLDELILVDSTVAILRKFLPDMTNACLRPDHRIPQDAQPLRQGIRGLETNALDIQG